MTSQSAFFHALLRPAILQILRATGYHSAKPSVVDSMTDIAARYLSALCEATASHAVHNHGDAGDYSLLDVRMALQDAGALPWSLSAERRLRNKEEEQQEAQAENEDEDEDEDEEDDDDDGADEFVEWFSGPGAKMQELVDADGEADYLHALKKKHAKTATADKYIGTVIGKPIEGVAEVQVEGGPVTSIHEWNELRNESAAAAGGQTAPPPLSPTTMSSGLSSVGSRLGDEDDMDLS